MFLEVYELSYCALYRKYRPSSLEEITGQKNIVKIIKNSLKSNKVSHAYLFSGPRGTGKTTMAKVLSKVVNCLEPVDGVACGKCQNCLSILNNSTSDIIEIDAASNNGVDEIREIRNKINLVPSELKYKVYIIDEVHMLSLGAFNALLKTLEEPPQHIIFILATTDLHKVPVTIISRCQCFDFKRLTENEIYNRLSFIADSEKINIDDEVLKLISNLSDGGMRDAIGMLDKVSSYSNDKITIEDFEELNGIVSEGEKIDFLKFLSTKDVSSTIKFIDKIYNDGKDLAIFCQNLLLLCRNLIVDYYSNIDIDFDINFLLSFIDNFSELSVDIKKSNNVRILFEVKVLSFMNLYSNKSVSYVNDDAKQPVSVALEEENNNNIDSVKDDNDKVDNVDKNNNTFTSNSEIVDNTDEYLKINSLIVNNCLATADKTILNNIKNSWQQLSDYALDSQFGSIASYLTDGEVKAASKKELIITFDYDSMVSRGYKLISRIESLFEKIFGQNYNIAIISTDEWKNKKNEYINNMKAGIKYEYIDISTLNTENNQNNDSDKLVDDLTKQAVDLFGNDVVTSV